jgi:hypothetical protein
MQSRLLSLAGNARERRAVVAVPAINEGIQRVAAVWSLHEVTTNCGTGCGVTAILHHRVVFEVQRESERRKLYLRVGRRLGAQQSHLSHVIGNLFQTMIIIFFTEKRKVCEHL